MNTSGKDKPFQDKCYFVLIGRLNSTPTTVVEEDQRFTIFRDSENVKARAPDAADLEIRY